MDANPEELRSKWVAHEGKKELNVEADDFVLGSSHNDWASIVDGRPDSFAKQIADNLLPGLSEELVPSFS